MKQLLLKLGVVAVMTALPLLSGCGRPGTGATTVPSVTVLPSKLETAVVPGPGSPTENGGGTDGGVGTLTGTVVFEGDAPNLSALIFKGKAPKDPTVCAATSAIPNERLVLGAGKGVANVFVYLRKAPKGWKPDDPESMSPDEFDQKGCVFLPHAKVVRVKRSIMVKSGDPIAHNTHTFGKRNKGENFLVKASDRVGVKLVYPRPESEPIEVRCDFHNWMLAYHLPLDHPFAVVTDAGGKFMIPDLPAGKHTFVVWHEGVDGGYLERSLKVEIKAGEPTAITINYPRADFAAIGRPNVKVVNLSRLGN